MLNNNRLRQALLALGIIFLLFVGFQSYQSWRHRGLIGVKVVVLPTDSTLMIDSKTTRPGKIYLTKGDHTLVAYRMDFENDKKSISTNDISKDETIYMLPAARSVAAKQWLLQHPDIQRQREAAGGAEAERARALLVSKYPIINKLPYENFHFKIDYSVDSNSKLSFTITLYAIINRPSQYDEYKQQLQQYKTEALQYLSSNGVDPARFTIKYIPSL